MVVFQQLSGTELGDRRRLALLRDRAVIATEMSFTITDPRLPDDPLVWVNPSFTRLTGYRLDEVVGRNCRLLQGPNTDPVLQALARIAGELGIDAGQALLSWLACRRAPVIPVVGMSSLAQLDSAITGVTTPMSDSAVLELSELREAQR